MHIVAVSLYQLGGCFSKDSTRLAVLPLAQVQVTSQTASMMHLTTDGTSLGVRVEPHHNAGLHGRVRKISKVRCTQCKNNLGNVQQIVPADGRFQKPLWYLKTKSVGFRRFEKDDASVVRVLPHKLGFSKFLAREGITNEIGELVNKLSDEYDCPHYKPEGVFALEGALAVAKEDEIDAVLRKLANARITPPNPPTPREYRKAVQDVTRVFVRRRPPRRQPPQVDDERVAALYEQRANRQADKLEALTHRGEQLLLK